MSSIATFVLGIGRRHRWPGRHITERVVVGVRVDGAAEQERLSTHFLGHYLADLMHSLSAAILKTDNVRFAAVGTEPN